MDDFNSLPEVAAYLKVSVAGVRGWIRNKQIKSVKAGGRVLITKEAITAFLAKSNPMTTEKINDRTVN